MKFLIAHVAIAMLFAIAPMASGQPLAKPAGVHYALVVGVNDYEDQKHLKNLAFAENDAKVLAETLRNAGFRVTLLLSSQAGAQGTAKANIEANYLNLLKVATGNDLLVVAMAGHGQQFQPPGKTKVEPFFCPHNCAALEAATQVSLNAMIAAAGKAATGKVLFLIDACRTNPDPNSRDAEGLNGNAVTINAQTVALFAAAYGQKSREHKDAGGIGQGHGLFMSEVIAGFRGEARNKRGDVSWNSLVEHVVRETASKSKRLFSELKFDEHQASHNLGSIVGEAILIPAVVPTDPDDFESYFERTADKIARFLNAQKETNRIAVSFTPVTGSSKAGAGYERILAGMLAKRSIKVVDNADFTYKGSFGLSAANPPPFGLKFMGAIVDDAGNPIAKTENNDLDFERLITSKRRLAEAFGVSIPDQHRPQDPAIQFRIALKKPTIHIIDGYTAKASRNAQFGVQVLVNKKPLPLEEIDGYATFRIGVDDQYELKNINYTDYEAAITTSIDGLSEFHFAEEINATTNKPFRYSLVSPQSSDKISGWFKKPGEEAPFTIVPPGEGVARKQGQIGSIGQITLTFHAAWEENAKVKGKVPRDEPKQPPKVVFDTKSISRNIRVEQKRLSTTIANGAFVKREETYTTMMQVFETKTAMQTVETGMGQDRITNSQGVSRVIGAERDTITLHYISK